MDEEVLKAWYADLSGKPGGQATDSDIAVLTVLSLKTILHLPLRQLEGVVASLFQLMGLVLNAAVRTHI